MGLSFHQGKSLNYFLDGQNLSLLVNTKQGWKAGVGGVGGWIWPVYQFLKNRFNQTNEPGKLAAMGLSHGAFVWKG